MNLVTAALVENAMETAAHEAEEERQKLKKRVQSAPWLRSISDHVEARRGFSSLS